MKVDIPSLLEMRCVPTYIRKESKGTGTDTLYPYLIPQTGREGVPQIIRGTPPTSLEEVVGTLDH
jgi:hypothetical protein